MQAICTHAVGEQCDCPPPPTLHPDLGPLIAAVSGRAAAAAHATDALDEAAALVALGPVGTQPEPLDELDELDGVTCLASVPERPTIPLDLGSIPLFVPRADVTLAFGQGKIGKGRMTWALIAQVTNDGGDVVVILPEDKVDEQMAPRGRAAGADMTRVWDMTRLPGTAERFKLSASERHEGHIAHLRAFLELLRRTCLAGHANPPGVPACEKCGQPMRDPRLVVIDPLSATVGWGTMLTVAGARRLIEPLQDLADVTGVAILCIGHTTKAGVLAGSAGLSQACRLIYKIDVDPANSAYRQITVEQANNLPPGVDGLRFTITEDDDGRARVQWLDRAALEKQRTSWRNRITGLPPASAPPAARTWAAAWSTRMPGQQPEVHPLPGSWADLDAAQAACQDTARTPLTWQPSARRAGCWTATIRPSGPSGPEVSYAVSTAPKE